MVGWSVCMYVYKGPRRERRRTLGKNKVDVDEGAEKDQGRGHVDGALLAVLMAEDDGAAAAEDHLFWGLVGGGRLVVVGEVGLVSFWWSLSGHVVRTAAVKAASTGAMNHERMMGRMPVGVDACEWVGGWMWMYRCVDVCLIQQHAAARGSVSQSASKASRQAAGQTVSQCLCLRSIGVPIIRRRIDAYVPR